MQIEHKQIIDNGNTVIYINIYTEDKYEFAKENFAKSEANKSIRKRIVEYVKEHVNLVQGAIVVIAINGIVVGALSLDKPEMESKIENNVQASQDIVTGVAEEEKEVPNISDETAENVEQINDEKEVQKDTNSQKTENEKNIEENEDKKEAATNASKNNSVSKVQNTNNTNTTSNSNNTNNNISSSSSVKKEESITASTNNNNTVSKEENVKSEDVKSENTTSNYYIKLNNGGVVQNLELEEYIIGVVAAEMPASFNIEALKAQAVAARTYAVKKTSQGRVLVNSTADQVYKTEAQMKSTWGSEYNYYYNRVKSAVEATQGLVLKYNGEYIDAQYSAMTNGKTELPEYVWSFSRPYLQCVSSSWDEQVKNFKVTKSFTYDKVSSALGQIVTKDTEIEVLSRTVSDRVETIRIGSKTYTGVEVRSKLGLRSTDFTIELGDMVNITTKGYGHGVGMSQYGANVAANEGYTYSQILSHYYVGAVLTKI